MTDYKVNYQKPSNKNGYEIRADILAMAKSFVEHEYMQKVERCKILNKDEYPSMYTIDDILEIAEQMYTFVSQNPKQR